MNSHQLSQPRLASQPKNQLPESISVIGLGLMGTLLSITFANNGHKVIAVDMDLRKVNTINQNRSPIQDFEVEQALIKARRQRRLIATGDFHHAIMQTAITLVCVGKGEAINERGISSSMQTICQQIGASLATKGAFHLVVLHSQINPTLWREQALPIIEHWSNKRCGEDFGLCFLPLHVTEKRHFDAEQLHTSISDGAFDSNSGRIAQNLFACLNTGLDTVSVSPLTS